MLVSIMETMKRSRQDHRQEQRLSQSSDSCNDCRRCWSSQVCWVTDVTYSTDYFEEYLSRRLPALRCQSVLPTVAK
ncbi:hypothetical protein ATANTOWER_028235 [Ataeniobius toweri]|uniref:Uncharacterized protein n=1 Tax=Ataeniobius toweri TaxID=208326 RepID=A0ABU7C4H3_9TELE|nr:hypothetical protein [Ataeniobius toweri]